MKPLPRPFATRTHTPGDPRGAGGVYVLGTISFQYWWYVEVIQKCNVACGICRT